MSDYKSNYGVNQLTPEFLSSLTTSDCFGPAISNNGKYYITTLNPNVDILSIPERLSYDPSADNYFGKYYGVSLVLDQTTSTDEARNLVNNAYGRWCEAYDANYTIPYQIDKTPDEVNRYISEVESTIGTQIERLEVVDDRPTIWYRDESGNLIDQQVEIKLNTKVSDQLNEIKNHYQGVYGTDKKVEIKKNEDGSYSLVVDGKEKKKFSLNKYDMSSIENSVGSSNKIKSSDKLNDDNKNYLENFYKESYKDRDVIVKKNDDGTYSLIIGEDVEVDFKKGTTIGEAIAQANEEINSGKAIKTPNKGQNTNRLNDLTGQGYRIYINVNDFEEIQSSHNMAKGILDDCGNIYRTDMFTEKLAEAYSSLVEANEDPTKKITKSSELLNNVVTNVRYSLEAYKNIDHDLGIVINSVIEEIFSINSYSNKHSELGGLSENEKEAKVKEMISFLDTNIKDLEEDFKKNYDNGYGAPLSEQFAEFLVGLADAFSIDNTQSDAKYYPDQDRYMNEGIVRFDFDQIKTTINFIKEHDVINKLGSYVGTKDQGARIAHEAWEQSGMADLNEYILRNSNVSDYNNEQKNDYAERLFLTRFVRNQGSFRDQFSNKYGSDPVNFLMDDGLIGNNDPDSYYVTRRDLINDIKGLISTNLNAKISIKTYEIDDKTYENVVKDFNVFELADYYTSDGFKQAKQEINDSILDLRNTKYNYERYLDVLPYLGEKDNPKYLEYLTKDYSKYDLLYTDIGGIVQFLNQEEIALYMLLKETVSEDKASSYLDAMSDMIAQREGFQLAAERIYEMNKNGQDIWDYISTGGNGFTDGLEGFFRNLGNCFYSDGKRDAVDYRNMYMVSLLSENNLYNDKLSLEYRDILKRNYTVMSSVGQMLIPAVSRFIPYAGWALSPALLAMSTFGGSVEAAKQMGKSDVQAYLYGGFQACSTMVLYKLMSGIPGIGNGKIPNGWMDFANNVGKAAERSVISTYVDATLRSTILQEQVDFSRLPEQAFDSAINAMFVSTIMQAGTKLTFKIADGITIKLSGGEYGSYQDFLADTEAQFKATPTGQRLLMLYRMNPEQYKNYRGHVSHGLVDRLVKEMNKNDNSQIPWDLTDRSESIIGRNLPTDGPARLVFDPNSNNYYIINAIDGSGMTIPSSFISNHEPGPIQYTAPLVGLYSGTNISESSFTPDGVLPSVYNSGSNTVPNSEVNPEVATLKTNTEVPAVQNNDNDVLIVAQNDETKTPVGSITPDEYYKEHTEVKTLDEIAPLLSKDDYSYWGHATPENENNDLFTKILDEGLRFPHDHSLDATANPIDKVKDVSVLQDKLDSWEHRGSQHVFIVRLPAKYTNYQHSAVWDPKYFLPMAHETTDGSGRPTYAIDPEYILGYYDKNSHEFVMNRKFEETPTPEMEKKAQTIMDQLDKEFEENLELEENGNSQNATLETLTNVPEKDPFAIDSFDSEDDWAFDTGPVETLSNAQESDPWDMSLDIPGGDDWGFDDEPKTPTVLKSPDEILETYKKDGMDKYSSFDLESSMDKGDRYSYYPDVEKQLKNYLGLARTPKEQEVLSEILLNGGYNGVGFDSRLCSHDNRTTEEARRLSMATLYVTNPDTFETLMADGVTLFHGTSSEILDKISDNGLLSVKKIKEMGDKVTTGEYGRLSTGGVDMDHTIRSKDFISFTDVFDVAYDYAGGSKDGEFGIVVGTTPDDIKSSRMVRVGSDITEVGVKDNLPVDKIKTLMVPVDKVDEVKKIVGDRDIKVLPITDYDKRAFSFIEGLETYDKAFDDLSEFIKSKPVGENSTPKPLNQLISAEDGKYIVRTPDGEEYKLRTIGIKHDAVGNGYGGVISSFDREFTEKDVVQLESGIGDHRFVTIGDMTEAKELLNSITTLADPETLIEKCVVVGETVNEYFGDFQLFQNRLSYFPDEEEVEAGAPQGKVSDLAHGQAAACIERAMLSQNLLKELGVDSTFKITGFINSAGNVDAHAFNIIKDDGKYYIFDATQPNLRHGAINPLVCELPEEVALKMLDPLSESGTSVKVTHFNPLQLDNYTVTYDAGWKDGYEATNDGDDVDMFNLSEYRINMMKELEDYIVGDNVEEKEAANNMFKSYILSYPSEATSYFRKQIDELLPSTKEELLDKAISSPKHYMLLHSIDISPEGSFYKEDKEAASRIYGKIFDKIKTGEFDFRNMDNIAPLVFEELDPLYPVRTDVKYAMKNMAYNRPCGYLYHHQKEIVDYFVDNNIVVNGDIILILMGEEVHWKPYGESYYKLITAGNYDEDGFDILESKILNDGKSIMIVANNHPEYLKGKKVKLHSDIDGFVEAASKIEGLKCYYEADRYDENIKTLHEQLGDKLLIRPKNNSNSGTTDYTYEEYIAKERIIESYADSLRDKPDKNGNIKHLTPYEKYIASHIITTKFAVYNLPEGSDADLSRSVYEFIDKTKNRPICCAGYVSMDNEILERQDYPDGLLDIIHWHVKAKEEGQKDVTYDNHDRSLVHLVDPTYGIDGIYMSDPTWDHIHTTDLTKSDVRERKFRHLLKTQEDLSYSNLDFNNPLADMHVETDKDMLSIADQLNIFDPDAIKTVREKINKPISNKDYILALCAINRFVDKNAVMPQERTVGENGFTISEYNRAALSAGMNDELIFTDAFYKVPSNVLFSYFQDFLELDKYGAISPLNEMLQRKIGSGKSLKCFYDPEEDVLSLDLFYQVLSDEDLNIIDNLPDDEWNYVKKEMGLKSSKYKVSNIMNFDGDTSIEDIADLDIDSDKLIALKQAENHEKLMSIIASLEDKPADSTPVVDQEESLKEVQVIVNAMDDLDKIAKEKGMTLADLGKQKATSDPVLQAQADTLAKGLQENAQAKEAPVTELMKTYQDSEHEGISINDLRNGVKAGSIKEYTVLMGLDHKFKDTDSLSGKILTDFNHHKYDTIDKCASNIHDSLRYTLVIDDSHYTDSVQKTVDNLRERGYLVTAKNFWGNKAYQGVNAVVTDRNTGFSFELQFHTVDSYYTKEFLTHDYYAIFRNEFTTQEEKDLANIVQMGYQKKVPAPNGIIGHDFN